MHIYILNSYRDIILIDQFNQYYELLLGIIYPIFQHIQAIAGSTSQFSSYKGTIFWRNISFVGTIFKCYPKCPDIFSSKNCSGYSLELLTSFGSFTPFSIWGMKGASLSFLTFRYTEPVSSFSSSLNSSLLRGHSRIIQNGASHSLPLKMFRAQSKDSSKKEPRWNFWKYLVNPEGQVVKYWRPEEPIEVNRPEIAVLIRQMIIKKKEDLWKCHQAIPRQ